MKKLLIKIPAMLAMVISLVSFVWYLQSIFNLGNDEIGLLSAIMAMFSVPFFFIDAIISFVKAIKKDDSKFNYILALILVGAIPMVVSFAGSGRVSHNVIWNAYYLLMFVLEVISIKKACAAIKADRKKEKENTEI